MLRIVKIDRRHPTELDLLREDGQKETLLTVRMESNAGDYGYVILDLSMRERETDDVLVADAHRLAREAISALHADLQKSQPATQ
jgi:carotenoid cleavage dioxygenase-like enzyme